MRLAVCTVLLAVLAGGGCAGTKASRPANETAPFAGQDSIPKGRHASLIITPETGLTGKVMLVNERGRYAILNFPVGHLPALQQHLNVYHRGLKSGELRVGGPQLDDNIVADVIKGQVAVGDEARSD